MILFVFLMIGSFIALSVILGFRYGLRMGQKSTGSKDSLWRFFIVGAAKIFLFHFVLALGWQVLIGLTDRFLMSFSMLLLSCVVAAIYAAVIWLPIYASCFWDTRRSGLKVTTA